MNSRTALDNADSNLSTAVQLDPRFERAVLLLAELKMRKGSPAAAVDVLVPLIKGATAGRPSSLPPRLRLSGTAKRCPGAGGLPADDGVIPARSPATLSHGHNLTRSAAAN